MVITTGAQQALDLIGKIFIDPGDLIAVEAPAYVGALTAFGAYEPRYLQIDLDDDGMIVDQLEEALVRGERPKFVYTVPNFGNPAGVTMSPSPRAAGRALSRGGHPDHRGQPLRAAPFRGRRAALPAVPRPRQRDLPGHGVEGLLPGVRVGWALAEQSVIQRLVLAKEAADLCGSSFTMLVTERYFAGDRWRANLSTFVDLYRLRRDAMLEALEEHFPDGATWTQPGGRVLRVGHAARVG